MAEDPNVTLVNTYRSRKFVLALIALIVITGVSVASIWFAAVAGILPTFVGGILGVLSVYYGGNVGSKFVVGKVQTEFKRVENEKEKVREVPADPE